MATMTGWTNTSTPNLAYGGGKPYPNQYYYGGPGTVMRGLNVGTAPKPKPMSGITPATTNPFGGLQGMLNNIGAPPAPPGGGVGGAGGGAGARNRGQGQNSLARWQQYMTSSIPLDELQSQYLPDPVVKTGAAQQFSNFQRKASPQPILESYGANENNMASAASGQYQPMIMARMQDPLQQAAMAAGDVPVNAALEKYRFGTKGVGAQTNEITGLANVGQSWYQDRLNNWKNQYGLQLALLNGMLG